MPKLIGTRVRFAPSPNGYLHLGHAYSALCNWRYAQRENAEFLLRIEDIDVPRSRPEFVEAIFEDLSWLGLSWPEPVLFQSTRFEAYKKALQSLIERGLVYPAFLSRREISDYVSDYEKGGDSWPRDPDGSPHYPDICKNLSRKERAKRISDGLAHNLRLDMDVALDLIGEGTTWIEIDEDMQSSEIKASPKSWGDVVLARRDVPTSYHLSVVLDDAEQGVDFIIRGRDLYQSTSVHRVLQILLELREPNYQHHKLMMADEISKLSKSDGAQSLKILREEGKLAPQDVFELIRV